MRNPMRRGTGVRLLAVCRSNLRGRIKLDVFVCKWLHGKFEEPVKVLGKNRPVGWRLIAPLLLTFPAIAFTTFFHCE